MDEFRFSMDDELDDYEEEAGVNVDEDIGDYDDEEDVIVVSETVVAPLIRETGWHLLGTAKMGHDPANSVVDAWGRSHDAPNLFIFDGSIWPTSSGMNPTATIAAMALRCRERLVPSLADPPSRDRSSPDGSHGHGADDSPIAARAPAGRSGAADAPKRDRLTEKPSNNLVTSS